MSDVYFLVCKMLRWDDFVITANGVDHESSIPEGEKTVGFIPVYANMADAQSEAGDLDIIALMIKDGAFYKHEGKPDDNDTEES